MGNILDYIHWRGDLSFAQDPPNMVDNLIFSELSYADLRRIVPSAEEGGQVSLSAVCDRYLALGEDQSELINNPRPLLIAAAASPRFRDVQLSAFEDVVDEKKEEQFSAVTFTLPCGVAYVAFRGTDTSIAGWREDFNMSFLTSTPAQEEAARYLSAAARRTGLPLTAGGHSKGGNLAVYAAAFTDEETRRQLISVCSNDGPGFNSKVADSPEYTAIVSKVRLFLPESSLVGIMMANRGSRIIVKSNARGAMQHNPYTWEVMGPSFIKVGQLSSMSLLMDDTMRRWLDDLSDDEKKDFTAAVFEALDDNHGGPAIDLRPSPANLARALATGARILTGSRQADFLQVVQKLLAAGSAALKDGPLTAASRLPLLKNLGRPKAPAAPQEEPGEGLLPAGQET